MSMMKDYHSSALFSVSHGFCGVHRRVKYPSRPDICIHEYEDNNLVSDRNGPQLTPFVPHKNARPASCPDPTRVVEPS